MNRTVALLRGINVGKHAWIRMDDLRACFTDAGLVEVSTYINSGNVLFSSDLGLPELQDRLVRQLEARFGFRIDVLIRTKEEMMALAEELPEAWVNDDDQKTDVLFLPESDRHPGIIDEIRINPEVDHLIYRSGTLIWNIDRKDYGKSKMKAFIGTPLYKRMTARNINTVRKLAQLL